MHHYGRKTPLDMSPGKNGEIICALIAQGKTLKQVIAYGKEKNLALPNSPSTILGWVTRGMMPDAKEPYKSFHELYARARVAQAESRFDQIFDLADETTTANAHANRVKIDAIKWGVVKLNPSKYGDRAELVLGGKVEVATPKDHAPEWMENTLLGTAAAASHANPGGKSVH